MMKHGSPARILLFTLALAWAMVLAPPPAVAEDRQKEGFKLMFTNGIYGGALGILVGTALLAFVDDPGNKLSFISIGAAIGVLGGVGWGVYDSLQPETYVSLENGKLRAAWVPPEVQWVPARNGVGSSQGEVIARARVFGVRF